jgi:HK97 family phage major capsid protein
MPGIATRIEDLKKEGAALKTKMDEVFENGCKSTNDGLKLDPAMVTEFRKMNERAGEIVKEIKSYTDPRSGYAGLTALEGKNAGAGDDELAALPLAARGLLLPPGAGQFKSVGARFLESKEFKGRQPNGNTGRFELEHDIVGGGVERKDLYTSTGGTLTHFAFGQTEREPLVQRPYRSGRVRDLFPVANTNANLIEYLRVLGYLNGQNNAGMVPERTSDNSNFGLKPHTELQFQPAQAPIRTIAHWEVAHRNTLDDEPQLQSIIDTELLYGLRLMEDAQLLNGDGNGENILGILRTPGIQEYPGAGLQYGQANTPVQAKDTRIDAVRRAATRIMLAYYEPTGVVCHPFDWEAMELTKDANGNYIVTNNVQIGAEQRIWRMPVVATPAIDEGTALTGAFGLGAKVYDRQQSNIRIAEQHGDLFVRNAVVVLAEERVGLTVSRPESFIKIDFDNAVATPAAPAV